MLLSLSPAKTLDFATPAMLSSGRAEFAREARQLVAELRGFSPEALGDLMGISPELAALNVARYRSRSVRPAAGTTRPVAPAVTAR